MFALSPVEVFFPPWHAPCYVRVDLSDRDRQGPRDCVVRRRHRSVALAHNGRGQEAAHQRCAMVRLPPPGQMVPREPRAGREATATPYASAQIPHKEDRDMSESKVVLAEIRDTPLSADEVLAACSRDAAGGLVLFVGRVRDHDGGQGVEQLIYTAHPNAAATIRRVCEDIARSHKIHALAAVHRVGTLRIGEAAVVVAASASHRGDAFLAARALIDQLKDELEVWKHQHFSDGSDEWVAAP